MSGTSTHPEVMIHSKLTVVSSKPIGPGKTRHLTALNHAMDLHTLYFVFYYDHNLFGSFELDPLRECLSEVLSLYPAITGRIARGKDGNWELRCNDAGLRVIRARVDTTIHEWLRSATESQERDLTALEDIPHDTDTWSPFRIQINEFEGEGVAIGLSCSHMLADFTSAISFIKSWTEAYRHLPITHPPLNNQVHSEAALPLPGGCAPNTYSNANPTEPRTQTKLASATFKFSSSVVKQCLSQVHEMSPHATPFDFLSALFWTRIARFKSPKNDQTHSISICVDFRNMLKPTLPLGYFGNALHFSKLSLSVKDMESSQLRDVAGLVHTHLAELEDKEEEIRSAIDWLESQKEEGGKYISPNCMYGSELTFVRMEHLIFSSEQSLVYAAKFSNSEKPIHVSCYVGNVDREGLIMVMPSSEGGLARTVTVMLAEEQLAELCEDQLIMQLQPTMLFTATKLSHGQRN